MIAGRRRGLSPTMRRELRRRSAIEATIGHMKTDGRLDRNFLLGQAGDAINALLAAAGHNLRLGPLACLHPGRHRTGYRKMRYFPKPPQPKNISGLTVVQGRLT
jgi:hypothetical protein